VLNSVITGDIVAHRCDSNPAGLSGLGLVGKVFDILQLSGRKHAADYTGTTRFCAIIAAMEFAYTNALHVPPLMSRRTIWEVAPLAAKL
jgi:hypothetical protein